MTRPQKVLAIAAAVLLAVFLVQVIVGFASTNDVPGRLGTADDDAPGLDDTVEIGELEVRVTDVDDVLLGTQVVMRDYADEEDGPGYARKVTVVTVAISNPTDGPQEIGLVNSVLVDRVGGWYGTVEPDWLGDEALAEIAGEGRAMPRTQHVNPGQTVFRDLVFDASEERMPDHVRLVGGTERFEPTTGEHVVRLEE
ncbi:hypothetical protein [Georgenia sp. Z1491]|uniref:hypothetical protein n=1 Tax=Georgenia sp. Z1491 TaxID=3416707 RepID=UPI003CF17931